MKVISSASNDFYKWLATLSKNRNHEDLILFEGEDLVSEAYEQGLLKYVIIHEENNAFKENEIENILLSPSLYKELASFKSLPKMMGVATIHQAKELKGNLIYLDGVQDPGNVGTIIRTALALNYDGIMLSKDSAFPFASKVIQSSKGAIFKLPILVQDLKDFFKIKDYEVIGTLLTGEPLNEVKKTNKPLILVFGNEGHGIRKEVIELLDKAYLIPMHGIDSLNVSVASAIFMFVFRGQYEY